MPIHRTALWTIRAIVFNPALSVPLFLYIDNHYLAIHPCTGTSMAPTLSPYYRLSAEPSTIPANDNLSHSDRLPLEGSRDRILFARSSSALSSLQRGQIVAFWTPDDPERWAVKRIVALGGDTVVLDKRRRYDKGSREKAMWRVGRYVETDRLGEDNRKSLGREEGREKTIEVPWGHVWLEGDNWRESKDSNDYGPLSKALIVGRATHVIWPPSRFGRIPWEVYRTKTKVIPGQQATPPEEWAVHV